jgi:hypothetical protein
VRLVTRGEGALQSPEPAHCAARGRLVEALPIAGKAFALSLWFSPSIRIYAGSLVRMGQVDRSGERVEKPGSGERPLTASAWAIFHTCCGEIDLAADWYAKTIEEPDNFGSMRLRTPFGEPIRKSSLWPKLAAMMHLPSGR